MHHGTTDPPEDLRAWLTDQVADLLGTTSAHLETDALLSDYGFDSVFALTLAAVIQEELGMPVEATVVWDHPTIDELAAFLGGAREDAR